VFTAIMLSQEPQSLKVEYGSVNCACSFAVVPLPADVYSYHLQGLLSNTKYCVKVKAATIRGSAVSPDHRFSTTKYGKYDQYDDSLLSFLSI